jgi:hypothetical protein
MFGCAFFLALTNMLNLLRYSAIVSSILIFPVLALFLAFSYSFPSEEVPTALEMVLFIFGVPTLLTAGYVFVFVQGANLLRSTAMRLIGGLLLSFPIGISALPILTKHPEFNPVAIPFLAYSVLLFSAFVFPAWLKHMKKETTT